MEPPFFNINKICRICLRTEILVSVFNEVYSEGSVRYLDMIAKLNLFKVDIREGLPTTLCQTCIYRLIDAFNLKQESFISDCRLREFLALSEDKQIPAIIDPNHPPPNQTSSNPVKDEEIYAAMNAVCEIFDRSNHELPTETLTHTEDDLLDIVNVKSLDEATNDNTQPEINVLYVDSHDEGKTNCEVPPQLSASLAASETKCTTKEKSEKLQTSKTNLKYPEKCPECGKRFAYSSYLKAHVRIHTGEKPFQCDICKKTFSQSGNLNLHLRVHKKQKLYQCEKCSKMFSTSSNLNAHKRIHSSSRIYKCEQCPKTFKTNFERNNHSGTHTGIKTHICRICERAFYKTSYLNQHIRTVHKNVKSHKCSECGKLFSNSSNLTCHFRIHTGEKPFRCDHCNASFNQSSALIRHSKKHKIE